MHYLKVRRLFISVNDKQDYTDCFKIKTETDNDRKIKNMTVKAAIYNR
jgi:hypothetical protein